VNEERRSHKDRLVEPLFEALREPAPRARPPAVDRRLVWILLAVVTAAVLLSALLA
jgi:hypothetical protein